MGIYNMVAAPPLGPMYISSVLRNLGHEPAIYDARFYPGKPAFLAEKIIAGNPDIVGLSAFTPEAKSMHAIAGAVKSRLPGCKIVAGGPHPTACPEDVLADNNIDFVVIGEGEDTFVRLLEETQKAGDYGRVKGIAFRRDGAVNITEPAGLIEDLDSLPYPAWDLVEIEKYAKYHRADAMKGKHMLVFTSRGCPYGCIYCHRVFGKKFRSRSPENVIGEIRLLVEKYGIRDIHITDDTFNYDMPRAKDILRKIIQNDFKLRLSLANGLRTDLLDDEFLELLKKAGAYYLAIAIETASPRMQGIIKKHLDLKKADHVIEKCRKLGIFTRAYVMLGLPTETEQEIMQSIEYVVNSGLRSVSYFILNPFKGTELFENYCDRIKQLNTDVLSFDYEMGYHNLSEVSDKRLQELKKIGISRFYSLKRIMEYIYYYPVKKSLVKCIFLHLIHRLKKLENGK